MMAMATLAEIMDDVLQLPRIDRSYLAQKLIESLDREVLSETALQEYDKRVERWNSGQSKASTAEELDTKISDMLAG